MALDKLHLDLAGAAGDLAGINTHHLALTSAIDQGRTTANNLFSGGALSGAGADAGGDFNVQHASAGESLNEVIMQCNNVVRQASSDTDGYDRGGFTGVFC